jgi:hypothetical protein
MPQPVPCLDSVSEQLAEVTFYSPHVPYPQGHVISCNASRMQLPSRPLLQCICTTASFLALPCVALIIHTTTPAAAAAAAAVRPAKYFSIDRVFRNEAVDRTHLAEFHQVEGLVCDRGLTLGHLIATLQVNTARHCKR